MINKLSDDDTSTLDWTGCAIGIEYDPTKSGGKLTVHQQLAKHLLAADYIAVHQDGEHVQFSLYHCKGADVQPSGGRVGDVYEVAGQVLKSVAYCDPIILRERVEHRTHLNLHITSSRFILRFDRHPEGASGYPSRQAKLLDLWRATRNRAVPD